jgi:predicted branched-subunit amino acid permease
LGFWLTDESFVVVVQRYEQTDESPYKHWFFLGSAVSMYSNWQLCTFIGLIAGSNIPNPASWGLDFSLIVTFIGLLVPLIKNRAVAAAVVVASIVAVVTYPLPNQLYLMLAALSGIVAGMIAETLWIKPETKRLTEAETT